jgi:prophage regulatory protein
MAEPARYFIRMPEVIKRVGLSERHIYRMIKNGEFPAPKKLGKRASGWDEQVITQWQLERPEGTMH